MIQTQKTVDIKNILNIVISIYHEEYGINEKDKNPIFDYIKKEIATMIGVSWSEQDAWNYASMMDESKGHDQLLAFHIDDAVLGFNQKYLIK